MVTPELINDLKRDEGCRLTAYRDTVGVWTIGYGHAYVEPGTVWTQAQAEAVLREDVEKTIVALGRSLPWFLNLDQVRQDALINMAFNLGVTRLMGFRNTLAYLQRGEYEKAASNVLLSKWARQVGNRAFRISKMFKYGKR